MNAKGTQNNPYSVSEYQDLLENHLWEGGWVVITAQNIYITKKRKSGERSGWSASRQCEQSFLRGCIY